MTAIVVFILLCLVGVFVLAMRRAPIWGWALAVAAAVLVWRTGLIYGNWQEPAFNLLGILAWVPVVVLAGLAVPPLRRAALITPLFHKIKGILPQGLGHRAGGAQRRAPSASMPSCSPASPTGRSCAPSRRSR